MVQIDGRRKTIRDAAGVREKFGVDPPLIPDLLAPVGDRRPAFELGKFVKKKLPKRSEIVA